MKLQRTKRGFTLIELMVVITIIGILATGAVSVYTSQIQKARDSNRITTAKAFQSSIEQLYSDNAEYPNNADASTAANVGECTAGETTYNVSCVVVMGYMADMPSDPKQGSQGNGSNLVMTYNVIDNDGVDDQKFELSIGFEAKGSVASKANNDVDGGGDATRMEIGHVSTGTDLIRTSSSDSTSDGPSTGEDLSGDNSCEAVNGASQGAQVAVNISGTCGTSFQ